jgi:hypothetical protein
LGITIATVAFGASIGFAQQGDGTLQKGNEAYQYWCATCHGAGPGHPGTTALAAKYKGALPGLLERRKSRTPISKPSRST